MNTRTGSGLRIQVPTPDPHKNRFSADFYAVRSADPEMRLCGSADLALVPEPHEIRFQDPHNVRI